MFLGLLVTNRCTAYCAHCGVSASPHNKADLSLREMTCLISESAHIAKNNRTPLVICFSGGEPFLHFDNLVKMTRYAKDKCAKVNCVTNGYWADTYGRAWDKLVLLKEAGLDTLSLSHDYFHEKFVPLENLKTIFKICKALSITFEIKYAVFRKSKRITDVLKQIEDISIGVDFKIHEFKCVPAGRAKNLTMEEFLYQPGLPQESCTGQGAIAVSWDGGLYPCCTPGWPRLLCLGNIREKSFTALLEKAKNNLLLRLLRHKGPVYLVPFLEKAGYEFERGSFVNECHLCHVILRDARRNGKAISVLRRALNAWKKERESEKNAVEIVLNR